MTLEIITVQNIHDRLEQIALMLSGFYGPIECDAYDPDYEKCSAEHEAAYQQLMAEKAKLYEQLAEIENNPERS